MLAIDLITIGALSLRAGGPLSFDALKHEARATAIGLWFAAAMVMLTRRAMENS